MNSEKTSPRRPVFFCYACPAGFSGQKEATEMVIRGLSARGWDCRRLPQPVLERDRGGVLAYVRFGAGLMAAWLRSLRMISAPRGFLCVNLGQTRIAFLRDAVPLLIGRLLFGRAHVVVSLHGSLFMQWAGESWNARLFRILLRRAGTVTVLGEHQRARLIALGLGTEHVEVVVNSCSLPPVDPVQLREKRESLRAGSRPLRVLHLSSLIATKGFPAYLEALAELGARDGGSIEAVLCGKVTASEFQDRFPDAAAAESWIEETVAGINRGGRVRVRWVRGAVGREKVELFRNADIFVLPTRYAVEAQPIVLLEAMASGCAIVTTAIGEIPTILDDESALFLRVGSTGEITAALKRLAGETETVTRLASAAHRRFLENYELGRHLDGWEARLQPNHLAPVARSEPVLSKS
jgi:glycosyltransferase involved in cell wall biosynthesis